jgi:ABC-type phosphate/phosphonate transport system substrate-binding protein
MYDFPEIAGAHEWLWRRFVELARSTVGAKDVPLTQVCGYPLVTSLRGRFDAIALPVYDVPFSSGATHCGLIVVAAGTSYATLPDLRGTRFALNAWDSNTGMNLPRRLFAPLAERSRFFSGVVETGSHLASLAAVRSGAADVASIDNVTFALLAQHRPAAIEGVRILARTAPSPTAPFVAPIRLDPRANASLYVALEAAIDELRRGNPRIELRRGRPRTELRLLGIEPASVATYEPLLRLEDEAADLGYGALQ